MKYIIILAILLIPSCADENEDNTTPTLITPPTEQCIPEISNADDWEYKPYTSHHDRCIIIPRGA